MKMYLRKELRRTRIEGRETTLKVVAYYSDSQATDLKATNPWPSQPTRRNKTVVMNCYKYEAIWLEDKLNQCPLKCHHGPYG